MFERTDEQWKTLFKRLGVAGIMFVVLVAIKECGPCEWWDNDPISEVPARCVEPSLKDWRRQ